MKASLVALWLVVRRNAPDFAERVASTFVQAFVATLIVAQGLGLSAVSAAALAGLTAAINLVYRLLTAWQPSLDDQWLDFVERIVVTFFVTMLGALSQTGHYGLTDLRAAALAGTAAALVAVKAGLAKLLGSVSFSLLDVGGKHEAPQTPAA